MRGWATIELRGAFVCVGGATVAQQHPGGTGREGLECVLNGLYLTRGEQLADHHMVVEHAQPNGASHEYFNGILDDRSRGVFHGRILVQSIAQKTDAKQTNKNLLLSEDATRHQTAVGDLRGRRQVHPRRDGWTDEPGGDLLPPRARLGLATARRMLMHAFAGEIVDRVQHEPYAKNWTAWYGIDLKRIRTSRWMVGQ
jgi:Fe-S cluster assembly protein SufD